MKRREFITLLGGTAAWPLASRAQQAAMPTIGFLHTGIADNYTNFVAGFRHGLAEGGYVEGQNVTIEFRWANNRPERLFELAADLVRRQVAVLVSAGGAYSALAAKAATPTIPIVLAFGSDPVQLGLVASLNRPGGNVTGATAITTELMGKRLALLCELVPQVQTIAYIRADPQNSTALTEQLMSETLVAARALGRQVFILEVGSNPDFDAVFASLANRRINVLMVAPSPIFDCCRERIAELAIRHKIAVMYQYREFVAAGGLMSYGADFVDMFRQAGVYVGKILKGAKPADLPILQSTKFELVINIKTAKALGLTIPQSLLLSADEVIE